MEIKGELTGNPVYEVVLRMTPKEASVLRAVMGAVCGYPSGPRGMIKAIYRALESMGVQDLHRDIIVRGVAKLRDDWDF